MPKISEERREERRRAILHATMESLAQHGYAGTSMRTIAEAAGLTKGGLYAYFENKEAILLEMAAGYMQQQLSDFLPREGESARVALVRVLAGYERSPATPEVARAQRAILDLWTFAGDVPSVRAALQERYGRYLAVLTELVRIGQREGSFRLDVEAEHVAGLILASRDGMVFHAVKLDLPVPTGALTVLLREMILHQLEAAVDRA
jgi:AcrR family transcriptional regulator